MKRYRNGFENEWNFYIIIGYTNQEDKDNSNTILIMMQNFPPFNNANKILSLVR